MVRSLWVTRPLVAGALGKTSGTHRSTTARGESSWPTAMLFSGFGLRDFPRLLGLLHEA
jgi:hypothetical protein